MKKLFALLFLLGPMVVYAGEENNSVPPLDAEAIQEEIVQDLTNVVMEYEEKGRLTRIWEGMQRKWGEVVTKVDEAQESEEEVTTVTPDQAPVAEEPRVKVTLPPPSENSRATVSVPIGEYHNRQQQIDNLHTTIANQLAELSALNETVDNLVKINETLATTVHDIRACVNGEK